jgi:hypothetical protein
MSKISKHRFLHASKPKEKSAGPDQIKVSELARRHTAKAVETLFTIMQEGESAADRIAAARVLLDHAWGRPPVQVDINATSRVNHITFNSKAEFRQALLERGLHPKLLPPALMVDPPTTDATAPESSGAPSEEAEHAPAKSVSTDD